MTIIVGLICQDSIVLASDSQTTYSSSTGATQRLDSSKISVLDFANTRALVAQSGDETLSARAVEILTALARGQSLSDYRAAADMAQAAVRKVKEELQQQNLDCSMDELHKYIRAEGLNFELMIAHYHEGKPCIFTIDFALGIAAKKNHTYTAIGCGSAIASYILSWFNVGPKTEISYGTMIALYTIEEVKKVDPYCGGKTRFAVLAPGGIIPSEKVKMTEPEILDMMLRAEHDEYVSALAKIDKEAKEQWRGRMAKVLFDVNEEMVSKKKSGQIATDKILLR